MSKRLPVLAVVAVALCAPAAASADALCTLQFAGTHGTASCTGSVGWARLDPTAVPAELDSHRLTFRPWRLMGFNPRPMHFTGTISASAMATTRGEGLLDGLALRLRGLTSRSTGRTHMVVALRAA